MFNLHRQLWGAWWTGKIFAEKDREKDNTFNTTKIERKSYLYSLHTKSLAWRWHMGAFNNMLEPRLATCSPPQPLWTFICSHVSTFYGKPDLIRVRTNCSWIPCQLIVILKFSRKEKISVRKLCEPVQKDLGPDSLGLSYGCDPCPLL